MGKEHVMNTYSRFDIIFDEGKGTYLYDQKGNAYLDFVAGIAVNCLGHCHPVMAKALEEQGKKLIHISNLYWNTNQMKLAEKLVSYSDHSQVFFNNSGTEANETALKMARKYGSSKTESDKNIILYMKNSFHGRSMGALSVTGQEKYQEKFRPLIGGVEVVEFNNIEDLKSKMNAKVCGVILETIQGEGGILLVNQEFLNLTRELCDQFDALLIFDEVQCGIGRTGQFYAYQAFGVIPDIVTMAKGLGGGFPIGAVLANNRAVKEFKPGDHGCTFGGSPLACAVSLSVIEELMENGVIEEVDAKSAYMVDQFNKIKEKNVYMEDITGKGLILGIKIKDELKVADIVKGCFEKKLLLIGAGNNTIRWVPPLNVSYEEIDLAIELFEQVMDQIKINF